LALARSRSAEAFRDGSWQPIDLRSDLSGVQRQHELVAALRSAARAELDDRPLRLSRVVDTVLNHVKLDDTFGRAEVLQLARILVGVDPSRFETEVLAVAPSPTNPLSSLAAASGSDGTLRQLGGSLPPSALAPVPPDDGDGIRPC